MHSFFKGKLILFITCISTLFGMFLLGCQAPQVQDETNKEYNKIKAAQLSKSEENIFGAAGAERYFVFEYNLIDITGKSAHIWVDYYEKGEFISNLTSGDFAFDEKDGKEGRIALTINDLPSNTNEREFVVSLMDEDGITSGSIAVPKNDGDITSSWEKIDEKEIILGEDMILAILVENEGDQGVSIDKKALEEDTTALRDVLNNDYVYILNCRFE